MVEVGHRLDMMSDNPYIAGLPSRHTVAGIAASRHEVFSG